MLKRIGAVARELNLSVRRILQYEEEGLVFPKEKTSGGHRLYGEHEINHIKNIVHLIHDQGLTLAGIKLLLRMSPCWKIFPCAKKDRCLAFLKPHYACWELREKQSEECVCTGDCERCPIYLVRDFDVKPLFRKMPAEVD